MVETSTTGNAGFYDTDNIVVSQEESFRLCSRCSGYQKVLSVAQPLHRARPTRVAAVIIPWHACRSCRSEAEEAFDSTSVSEFDYVPSGCRDRPILDQGARLTD